MPCESPDHLTEPVPANTPCKPRAIIIGAGPAGLMAAEALSAAGVEVHVHDAMPSVGRKFLLAGIGGLNLTHAEPLERFVTRYGERRTEIARWLGRLGPQGLRDWAQGLGIDTFVGSSQRVFPTDMKAAPLLRAWLHRLRHPGSGVPVQFHMRQRWNGVLHREEGTGAHRFVLEFDTPNGPHVARADAVVLALGGGSWARLGSDGAWQSWLAGMGVGVSPLKPANCGFDVRTGATVGWSDYMAQHHAGTPLKSVALSYAPPGQPVWTRKGEFVITASGIEGSLVYALSARLRDDLERLVQVTIHVDLKPDWSEERVLAALRRPRGKRSLSKHLHATLGLQGVHTALLHELLDKETLGSDERLARAVKALAFNLHAPRPLDEAISSAGGVQLEALTGDLMLREQPGLFCAGEMLDWEAPTGGYLLTACMASGLVAGEGVLAYLGNAQVCGTADSSS
ncbi:BaiN/RdsA family NAD(P)/FAD-dependent oxidoreductase [Hydrogenophaga aquatica]